jgi:4-hydroxy-tetrahydrodipicolinate synthase
MRQLPPDFLRGSYPPLITPLSDGSVDYDTFATLCVRQVEQGSHGIVVNGTTGEPSTLTIAERTHLVRSAANAVGGRIPVVAATGSQSHAETVELTEGATDAGADAVLVVTPYYVKPPQRGLVEYFTDIGRRTPLPLLIYHIPGRTAVSLHTETLEAIADRTPTLVGMKHAVNDLGFASDVLRRLGGEFRLFVGLEELSFPMLAIGAGGLMNAVGNLVPAKVARLYEAVTKGDLEAARALHYDLLELNRAVFWDTNPIPVKYLMTRMGLLTTNEHRLPMVPATPELQQRLDPLVDSLSEA